MTQSFAGHAKVVGDPLHVDLSLQPLLLLVRWAASPHPPPVLVLVPELAQVSVHLMISCLQWLGLLVGGAGNPLRARGLGNKHGWHCYHGLELVLAGM